MINFAEKLKTIETEKKTNPIEIYEDLDRKSDVGQLRQIQQDVLTKWYNERKDDKNLIIKLSTGEGKTLIGLLLLQSKLNMNEGPCIYVTPTRYLARQVYLEAEKFGIQCCLYDGEQRDISQDYIEGKKILIVYCQKVFNSASKFEDSDLIPKVMLLDDSHACIELIKESFKITIRRADFEGELYKSIIQLFRGDLEQQGRGTFMDICENRTSQIMLVPYWSWLEKADDILKIISEYTDDTNINFGWNFLKDDIHNYCCYISSYKIEITPYDMNIKKYKFFCRIKQKVLMSATTQDDSFFIKGLGFNKDEVITPIKNENKSWSGEKMIIIPDQISDTLDRNFIINSLLTHNFDNDFGKVAITTSEKNAEIYKPLGGKITKAGDLIEAVNTLKKNEQKSPFYVFINKYDGIDLPDEACRILIIDSMPFFDNLSDRYEQIVRSTSEKINKLLAQKIEQGLGRGVRGEKDFCAIIITGNELVKFIQSTKTSCFFSEQTKKQIEIAQQLISFSKEEKFEKEIDHVYSLIKQLLDRDDGWKNFYKVQMDSIKEPSIDDKKYEALEDEVSFETEFYNENYSKAAELLQDYINKMHFDDIERGWYLQKLAIYKFYAKQKEDSINTQKSAFLLNRDLLRPLVTLKYNKINLITANRFNRIIELIQKFKTNLDLELYYNSVLSDFTFGAEAHRFEKALHEIGLLLGFECQRPDSEYNNGGPDNLWCVEPNRFFIIECKDEVKIDRTEIHKSETEQMLSSIEWFKKEYPGDHNITGFEVIQTNKLAKECNLPDFVRIIKSLENMKKNIKSYITELAKNDFKTLDSKTIAKLLDLYNLNPDDFESKYSVNFIRN